MTTNNNRGGIWGFPSRIGSFFYAWIGTLWQAISRLFSSLFAFFTGGASFVSNPLKPLAITSDIMQPMDRVRKKRPIEQNCIDLVSKLKSLASTQVNEIIAKQSVDIGLSKDDIENAKFSEMNTILSQYSLDLQQVGRGTIPLSTGNAMVVRATAEVDEKNFQHENWYDADAMAFVLSGMKSSEANIDSLLIGGTGDNQYLRVSTSGICGGVFPSENTDVNFKQQADSNLAALKESFNTSGSLPVVLNLGGRHWTSALLCKNGKNLDVICFDSLNDSKNSALIKESLAPVVTKLVSTQVTTNYVNAYDSSGITKLQKDGFNCGPWSLEFLQEALQFKESSRKKTPKRGEAAIKALAANMAKDSQYITNVRHKHAESLQRYENVFKSELEACVSALDQRSESPVTVAFSVGNNNF